MKKAATLTAKWHIGIMCHYQRGLTYVHGLKHADVRLPKDTDVNVNLLSGKHFDPLVKLPVETFDYDNAGSINFFHLARQLKEVGVDLDDKGRKGKSSKLVRFTVTGGEFGACYRNTVISLMDGWGAGYNRQHAKTQGKERNPGPAFAWLPEIVVPLHSVWDVAGTSKGKLLSAFDIVHDEARQEVWGRWLKLLGMVSMHISSGHLRIYYSLGDAYPDHKLSGLWEDGKQIIKHSDKLISSVGYAQLARAVDKKRRKAKCQ
jgi:hypothetical protein